MSTDALPLSAPDVEVIRQQRDEALRLLREAPGRFRLVHDLYWPWRRKVDTFLEALAEPGVAEEEAERGD